MTNASIYQYTNRRIHQLKNKKPLHLTQRRKGSAVPLCLVVYNDGPEGTRTLDPYNAIVVLSQLSYRPLFANVWNSTTMLVVDQFTTHSKHITCATRRGLVISNQLPVISKVQLVTDYCLLITIFTHAAPRRVRHGVWNFQPTIPLSGAVPTDNCSLVTAYFFCLLLLFVAFYL